MPPSAAATATAARPAALDEASLCSAFRRTAAERGDAVALRTPGDAVRLTWREYAARADRYAAGLAALGVGPGETVAIMLTNRPEFHLVDCAAMHLRSVPFSVYNTSSPEQLEYLLGDAGNRVVVCERVFLDRVLAARAACPAVEHVIVVDGDGEEGTATLDDLAAGGDGGFDAEAAARAVAPDDLLTLIYTSGTTGPPKGVQVTHANMLAEWRALHAGSPTRPNGRLISFLPAMIFGHEVTCCSNPRRVMEVVPEVRPTTFGAVPRIWEKTKAALEAAFDAEPDEDRRATVRWALDVGRRRVRAEQSGERVDDALAEEYARADELVLSKVREQLGLDQADRFVAGAAPTPVDVLEFFAAIGIGICESWGMSELTSLATINPPERIKIGTVGPALPGIEVRLADDGEVLVRGGIVTPGYRHQPERTADTIDADGWLHSGDIGTMDEDGYLTIVDRKKELIINAAGKNMSPANIEAVLKSASPLIGQACVIGDRRPYNVALLVLDPDGTAGFAAEHDLGDEALGALSEAEAMVEAVADAVQRANQRLSRVEQIKRFRILDTDWEPGGDELTPTMKLKRRPIAEKYAPEIEALYERE